MDSFLFDVFERLIDQTRLDFQRYLMGQFKTSRLTAIVGPRGAGKTTLMLQYIKLLPKSAPRAFYFSGDSVYFQQRTLLSFINDLYQLEGYRLFFIDEVHQYHNWVQELKNLYDAFPDIQIVYSGSSMVELTAGAHDLSRRAKVYHLPGMSFREYLNFTQGSALEAIDLSKVLADPKAFNHLGVIDTLLGKFKQYLANGYYPFVFEDPHSYYERVLRIIDKIIFADIPNCFDLKTQSLPIFKKMLGYLASIPPGEVNTNNIAHNMGVSHQTIFHYLTILEQVGLIQMVYPFEGGSRYLRKPQKIFLHNTTLFFALQQLVGGEFQKGTLRELYCVQALRDSKEPVYYSPEGDYRTRTVHFEVGGKNKTAQQIAHLKTPAFLVKDDMLTGKAREIPLWLLGFLY